MVEKKHKILFALFFVFSFSLLLCISVFHNRIDVLLLYLIIMLLSCIAKLRSLIGLICVFFISIALLYAPYQITMIHVKKGLGFVGPCSVDGVNKSSEEKHKFSYENSCVFLSDMNSGWWAKHYWVW